MRPLNDSKIGIAIIGYGYWGPNLTRNFAESDEFEVIWVCDRETNVLPKIQNRYPKIQVTANYNDVLQDPRVHAVVIATPVASHFDLAWAALQAQKHVLVEKPMTSTSEQSKKLIEEAQNRKLTLMVDHTFVYTGAVKKIKELLLSDEIGELYFYDSVRVNLGLFQTDVNVLWDLAVHDLSIMDYLVPQRPIQISATGMGHVEGRHEDIAYLTLYFENKMLAHFHVNWLSPVKVRRTLISGSKKMIVYDDLEASEKIKCYDRGIDLQKTNSAQQRNEVRVGYRTGDMWAPNLDLTEALKTEAKHFAQCIREQKTPLTDGWAGLRTVSILEAANQSLRQMGKPVPLNFS